MEGRKSGCGGFTLIEVLVTVLVLSLGLLGIAALQIASMRDTQGAYLKNQAVNHAYQLVDAMRANRDAARSGDYNSGFGEDNCGGGSAADSDLCAWRQALGGSLPGGAGSVSVNAANDIATVCIRWLEPKRRDDTASTACSSASDGNPPDNRQVFELQTVL